MKRYYVYMLQCFDGSYYVGITRDVQRRFWEHCEGLDTTCYTFMRRPLILLWAGEFKTAADAIDFEKKMKGWSRRKKRTFAQGKWDDFKRFGRGKNKQDRGGSTSPVLSGAKRSRRARRDDPAGDIGPPPSGAYSPLTTPVSASIDFLASPKSMTVFEFS